MKINFTLSKTIEYLAMSLVAHKERDSALFCLFEVVSGFFQAILAYYGYCDSKIYHKSIWFYYKLGQALLQTRAAFKLLQSTADEITKSGNFFSLQSGASGITE